MHIEVGRNSIVSSDFEWDWKGPIKLNSECILWWWKEIALILLTLIITDNSRMKTECCLLNLKAICERSSSLDLNFEGEWEKKECDHKGQR